MGWRQFVGTISLLYPTYCHLTRKTSDALAHRILLVASLAVSTLLAIAALWGEPILGFLSVGPDDLRVAGGLLALSVAFEMFQARQTANPYSRHHRNQCGYPDLSPHRRVRGGRFHFKWP